MNRQAAIEAGARALELIDERLHHEGFSRSRPSDEKRRIRVAAVIDAATPHLLEPVDYGVIDGAGRKTLAPRGLEQAKAWVAEMNEIGTGTPPYRVVALVPVDDQP